jgi:hypothetical protein
MNCSTSRINCASRYSFEPYDGEHYSSAFNSSTVIAHLFDMDFTEFDHYIPKPIDNAAKNS